MGIKFFCPNGHKLNVKAYLGGKKGICPKCGAKLLIPKAEGAQTSQQAAGEDQGVPLKASELQEVESIPTTGEALATNVKDSSDPIAASPSAVWYARLPSGQQYGPAPGELFRTWLDEGRVTPESLVWQEGWPDWKQASEVFSEMNASQDESHPSPSQQTESNSNDSDEASSNRSDTNEAEASTKTEPSPSEEASSESDSTEKKTSDSLAASADSQSSDDDKDSSKSLSTGDDSSKHESSDESSSFPASTVKQQPGEKKKFLIIGSIVAAVVITVAVVLVWILIF